MKNQVLLGLLHQTNNKEIFTMTYQNSTTLRKKGQHLTELERGKIAAWHLDGMSNRQIAKRIGVAPQTIHNEIKRGELTQVKKINGKSHYISKYNAEYAQNRYTLKRRNCHRKEKFPQVRAFLAYFIEQFKTSGFSPDAVVGHVHRQLLFSSDEMVCTTTLYKYIDAQRLEVRNIDLEMKTKRRPRKKRAPRNRKSLGKSIEERPAIVDCREEFGHFEIDTVIGKQGGKETAILTMTERKTRFEIIRVIDAKDADSVTYAIKQLIQEYGSLFPVIFRSITADNGSEFSQLSETLEGLTEVYFTHPYTSCERGTNENHNRMIRRYIPKGESIDQYTRKYIEQIADKMNQLPRKILNYATPKELFEEAVQEILG